MELYEFAREDLMAGKKILYVHGFASSGNNGTVKTMRLILPKSKVIAPDLPVEPEESMVLLKDICSRERPDLIIGTSMGGMYAEMLYGYDRIIVNPALHLADTLLKNNGLGRQDYHNERQDGQTSFLVTKGLLENFRGVSGRVFSNSMDDAEHVFGLFGTKDTMVNCFDEFYAHYPNAIHFDGEHYLNDHTFLRSVLPLIERIDDRQQRREKKSVVVNIDDISMSNGGVKAFSALSRWYNMYILFTHRHNNPQEMPLKVKQADELLGVMCWDRMILSSHKEMILADYLVDSKCEESGGDMFMGTCLQYGKDPFKTWDEIVTFFERLGGQ